MVLRGDFFLDLKEQDQNGDWNPSFWSLTACVLVLASSCFRHDILGVLLSPSQPQRCLHNGGILTGALEGCCENWVRQDTERPQQSPCPMPSSSCRLAVVIITVTTEASVGPGCGEVGFICQGDGGCLSEWGYRGSQTVLFSTHWEFLHHIITLSLSRHHATEEQFACGYLLSKTVLSAKYTWVIIIAGQT